MKLDLDHFLLDYKLKNPLVNKENEMDIDEVSFTKEEIICLMDLKNEKTLIGIPLPELNNINNNLKGKISDGKNSLLARNILLQDDQNNLNINPNIEPLINHLIFSTYVIFFNIGVREVGIRNYFFKIFGEQVIEHSISDNQTSQIKYLGNIDNLIERISGLIPLKGPEIELDHQENEIDKASIKNKKDNQSITYDEAIKKMVNCIQKPILSVSIAYLNIEKGTAKKVKSMSFITDLTSSWGIFVPEFPNSELEFLIRPVAKKDVLNIIHNWLLLKNN
jgi:hypothetical protein